MDGFFRFRESETITKLVTHKLLILDSSKQCQFLLKTMPHLLSGRSIQQLMVSFDQIEIGSDFL